MKKLYITVGVSGSGKTTYAVSQVGKSKGSLVNINRDNLRCNLFGETRMNYKFTNSREDLTTKTQVAMCDVALGSGKSVIISDTNLDPCRWDVWKRLAKKHGAEFIPVYFPLALDKIIARNDVREFQLPVSIIIKQFNMFEKNFPEQIDYWKPSKYTPDTTKPIACVVDVDGTLAHMNGRIPFEWIRVGEDTPDEFVIHTITAMAKCGYEILVMSGRDSVCRQQTIDWLDKHKVPYTSLFMRKSGDFRPDEIIKDELFDKYIRDHYNVKCVFDDRNKVVRMWRDKGIKVFQCQDGDF